MGSPEEIVEEEKDRERNWAVYLMLLVVGGITAVCAVILLVFLTDSVVLAFVAVAVDLAVIAGVIVALERDML